MDITTSMTVLNRDRPVTDEELLAARTEPCFVASLCYHKEGEETAYSLQLIPQSGDWTALSVNPWKIFAASFFG